MKKYDCSKTLDFSHEHRRMCQSFNTCEGCPYYPRCADKWVKMTAEHIAIVQAWSDEHPEQPKLTKEEDSFICSFKVTADVYIERKLGYLFLTMRYNSIELWPTMFPFIEEGETWALADLLMLEVEE